MFFSFWGRREGDECVMQLRPREVRIFDHWVGTFWQGKYSKLSH